MLCSLLLLALLATAQGRAVNISNTWVLPEEGFPVFYRYFRDRISWYEADAVCQFHHANLVTVDTTAQYDAVRAYLKELDISSAVWVGLIRSNPDGDFTWTDYRGLSGDGYWSSAPDARSAPLCAAADPAADYRWEARACGGPTVASFICELPVPQWALGNEGCMVRALPALTVLYLPESAAVQLTADCGMAGVKRVQCTGNVKHEELLKDLSCNDEDETSQPTASSTVTAGVTTDGDPDTNEVTTEEVLVTEHENDPLNSITSTPDLFKHLSITQNKLINNQQPTPMQNIKMMSKNNINLDVSLHNNLQSNDIPKIVTHDDFYSNEHMEKQEDEKHMQHKLLHDELARLGNFENIFSQPTDHFVPPLVMAKAKVNDDMTAVSFEEKLAQQHTEYLMSKHGYENNDTQNVDTNKDYKTTPASSTILLTSDVPQTSTVNIVKDKKEINKHVLPKKYDLKLKEVKNKVQPVKFVKHIKSTTLSSQTETTSAVTEASNVKNIVYFDPTNEDNSLDLTVIIKESEVKNDSKLTTPDILDSLNDTAPTLFNEDTVKELSMTQTSKTYEQSTESSLYSNVTLNDEIIKITFVHDNVNSSSSLSVFEVTTKMPIFKDSTESVSYMTPVHGSTSTGKTDDSSTLASKLVSMNSNDDITTTASAQTKEALNVTNTEYHYDSSNTNVQQSTESITKINNGVLIGEGTTESQELEKKNETVTTQITPEVNGKDNGNNVTESVNLDDLERNFTDTSQYIDDFQSPLLSGANEPLHKPNRSRRPQQPANRIKKFNPFRILG